MELPGNYLLVRKGKSQGQDLGEIPIFQEMVEEEMLVKEIELDQPKRLKISEDNRVRDAKGPQVGVAICLFQRRKWNRGGSGAGIHWSPRHPVLPAASCPSAIQAASGGLTRVSYFWTLGYLE